MKNKLQAIGEYIIVEMDKPAETTSGGIVIPEQFKNQPVMTGIVISAGPEASTKKGWRVAVNNNYPTKIYFEGKEYSVFSNSNVFAVVEN